MLASLLPELESPCYGNGLKAYYSACIWSVNYLDCVRQVDDDVQSLRSECVRLRGVIDKRDASIVDQRQRISQLEDSLAQVRSAPLRSETVLSHPFSAPEALPCVLWLHS